MQAINNLRSDLDLAREEMQTAYKDLNLTRLELEHSKKELERTPRSESEIPNMQQKTIEPASPKLPEMTSISSLPRDWFKEIEQVGKDMDKRLARLEKKLANATSSSLGKSIAGASGAYEGRRQASSSISDESQRQGQYSQEYTDLRNVVDNIELSLTARINEVEGSMQHMRHNLCNESIVWRRTESNDGDSRDVTARKTGRESRKVIGFQVGGMREEEDLNKSSSRNSADV